MKKKLLVLPVTLLIGLASSGCKALHVHDYSSPYLYDENSHWQICSKCQEKINFEAHTYNAISDECITCKYVDPVCVTNEEKHMTGLTKHGKTKAEVSIPNGITFVKNYAFKDAQATTVNLTKDIIGLYKDAFTDSKVTVINTEEELVHWVEYNGVYYKDDVLKNYEAMVNNKCYTTLSEALEAVKEHDTTITLLKNVDYSSKDPFVINYQIKFESYLATCELKANFYIKSSGSVTIPTSITYKGNTKLVFGETDEIINGEKVLVYNTGSLIFPNRDLEHKPDDVTVEYYDRDNDKSYEALGSVQTVNEALIVPKPYYAYGVFKLSKDLKNLIGLTPFGETIVGLNVTSVIKDQTVSVNRWAFTTPTTIVIHIPIHDIKIHANVQKGAYRHVIIGDGVESIGEYAFSNYFDHTQVPREVLDMVKALLCPLTTLEIKDSLKTIDFRAFYYCAGLNSVVCGSGLQTIKQGAFDCCFALKTADFSKSLALKYIGIYAFSEDASLTGLMLPSTVGWKAQDCGFLPGDLTSENAGHLFSNTYKNKVWERDINAKIAYYNPSEKDGEGRCNKVLYVNTFAEAYEKCVENGTIVLCDTENEIDIGDITINKNVNIVSLHNAKVGNVSVNAGKHVTFGKKISVKDGCCVTLNYNADGTLIKDVGGIGFEKTDISHENSLPTVKYKNNTTEYVAKPSLVKLDDNVEYNAYGMFDFTLNSSGNAELTIKWLSNLGQRALEFEVNDLISDKERTVEVSANVEDGAGAFKEHTKISKVTFGDSVTYINRDTLLGCSGLTDVSFGKSLKYIGKWALCGCTSLKNVTFSGENNVLETIDRAAFNNCKSLESFALPNQALPLNFIGHECFMGSGLKSLDLTVNTAGWRHGATDISENEMKDKAIAASYFTTKFPTEAFTRTK